MAVPAPVAASPAECGRCRHPMSRVGGFWFCERCGASRPQADPGPGPLPAEHPLAAAFDEWPSAVALPVRDFLAESRPFHALHRLVDVGELVTRFLVIVAVQAARARGELSDAFKLALGQKARRPTLGDWLDWGDHAVNECGEAPWCRELRAYWSGSWMVWMRNPAGQPDPERDLLGLRNRLAHFGRLTDDAAERLLGGHRVRATETLSRLSFLKHSRVVAVGAGGPERVLRGLPEPDGGWHAAARRIVLQTGGERIDLYPLHGFGPIERPAPGAEPTGTPVAQLYARADRGQPVEYTALSGPEAFARDPEAVPAFEQLFPTREWNRGSKKGTPPDDFETEIWDHSAGLVGRDAQADEVLSRLTGPGLGATGGALWIPGAPGVGKTSFLSLIASALVRARGRGHGSPAPVRVLVHYFKRNDYRNTALAFARRAVPALQPLCDRKHKLPEIDPRNPIAAVAKQLDGLQSPQPAFVFLIDGLDEAAAVDPTLPADLLALPDRPGVVWLFTGRPHQWLTELIDRKPAHRVPWPGGELPRLTAADARRFLEQECGRARFGLFAYDVPDGTGFTNAYLNELVRRSDGLPLYLRFLADQLKGGQRRFDPGDLPEQLAGYYDLLLRDFQISDRQLFLTRAAAVLNWAPAPVPESLLVLVLREMAPHAPDVEAGVRDGLRFGHLMLREAPGPGEPAWHLYHESFREHLRRSEHVRRTREEALAALAAVGRRWPEHRNPYLIRHLPRVLAEGGRFSDFMDLFGAERNLLREQEAHPDCGPVVVIDTLFLMLAVTVEMRQFDIAWAVVLDLISKIAHTQTRSPLGASRAGSGERAEELAAARAEPERTLWRLLLAGERAADDPAGARALLERIAAGTPPRFESGTARLAAVLLGTAITAYDELADTVARQLLDDDAFTPLLAVVRERLGPAEAQKVYRPYGDRHAEDAIGDAARAGRDDEVAALADQFEDEDQQAGALTEVAERALRAGWWVRAERFARLIRAPGRRGGALRQVGAALARAGDWQGAARFLPEIADGYDREPLRAAIAAAQLDAGDRAAAERTLEDARADGGENAVAIELAAAAAGSGADRPAEELLATLYMPEAQCRLLVRQGEWQARSGRTDAARETFRRAAHLAAAEKHGWAELLPVVMAAQTASGFHTGAAETAAAGARCCAETKYRHTVSEFHNTAARAFAERGLFEDATRSLAELFGLPNGLTTYDSLEFVIGEQFRQGDEAGAVRTVAAIGAAPPSWGTSPGARAGAALAVQIAACGRWDDAWNTAIRAKSPHTETLLSVIARRAASGDTGGARGLANLFGDPDDKRAGAAEVARALVARGRATEARECAAGTIDGPPVLDRDFSPACVNTLTELAARAVDVGRADEAERIFSAAVAHARAWDQGLAPLLCRAVSAFAAAGHVSRAEASAEQLPAGAPGIDTFAELGRACADTGDYIRSARWFRRALGPEPDSNSIWLSRRRLAVARFAHHLTAQAPEMAEVCRTALRAARGAAAESNEPESAARQLAEIALVCHRCAEPVLADEFLTEAEAAGHRADPRKAARVLTFVSQVASTSERRDRARVTAMAAAERAFAAPEPRERIDGAADAAILLSRLGAEHEARAILDRGRALAAEPAAEQSRPFCIGRLVYTAAQTGAAPFAWELLGDLAPADQSGTAANVLSTLVSDKEAGAAGAFVAAAPDPDRRADLDRMRAEAEEEARTWNELLDRAEHLPNPEQAVAALGLMCAGFLRDNRSARAHDADDRLGRTAERVPNRHRRELLTNAWSTRDDPSFVLGMDSGRLVLKPNPMYHAWRTGANLSREARRTARRFELLLGRALVGAAEDEPGARADLRAAARAADDFADPLHRAVIRTAALLVAAAVLPALAGELEPAALRAIDAVEAPNERSVLLRAAGWGLFCSGAPGAARGALERASAFARLAPDESLRTRHLLATARVLARCGFAEPAALAVRAVNEPTGEELAEFVEACGREGLQEVVSHLIPVCVWRVRAGLSLFVASAELAPGEAVGMANVILHWLDVVGSRAS